MDAVDEAGITAFYASTCSEPARQLNLPVRPSIDCLSLLECLGPLAGLVAVAFGVADVRVTAR